MTREERKRFDYDKRHRINTDGVEEKLCTKCDNWLIMSADNFYTDKVSPDGLNTWCKICHQERAKKYHKENYDECREREKKWFKKNADYVKEYWRQYDQEKPEVKKEISRLWRQNNPERIKEYNLFRYQHKNHKVTTKEWEACKKYFNHDCAYCGLHIEDHYIVFAGVTKLGDFHKEHVNHNGDNDLSNCVPACKSCNTSKHTDTLDKWYNEKNSNFTQERYEKIIRWINEDYQYYIEESKS